MKTDKLFYQLFLTQPEFLADLVPGIPADCVYEYSAPVLKDSEFRLDGLLLPQSEDPAAPLIFVEAQMQPDNRFYGRYFAEIYLYLYQYEVQRPWRGLVILQSRQQGLGSDVPYGDLASGRVQLLFLQDLLDQTDLPPALALLQLIVLPDAAVPQAARALLRTAQREGEQAFESILNLVEAILINKFPQLEAEVILQMLDLKTADITQTRFYQDVFQEGLQEGRQEGLQEGRQEGLQEGRQEGLQEGRQEGLQEGRQEGEATLIIRQLTRLLGNLPEPQIQQIRSLSQAKLEALGEALLDFASPADLQRWLTTEDND